MGISKRPLADQSIFIPREPQRTQELANKIISAGGTPIAKPVLEIKFTKSMPCNLNDFSIAIFTSVYSVEGFRHAFDKNTILPKNLKFAAIGPATELRLKSYSLPCDITPTNTTDSEGLLESLTHEDLKAKNIVIFCAPGGRDLLQQSLQKRNSIVKKVLIYQRCVFHKSIKEVAKIWEQNQFSLSIITSCSVLHALQKGLPKEVYHDIVNKKPLVALSSRIANECRNHGVSSTIEIAKTTNVTDIYASVLKAIKAK